METDERNIIRTKHYWKVDCKKGKVREITFPRPDGGGQGLAIFAHTCLEANGAVLYNDRLEQFCGRQLLTAT